MPRANGYQYETSPRKLEPEVPKKRNKKNRKIKVVEDLPRQKVEVSKEQKRKERKIVLVVLGIFVVLLTISYRNSQINEEFSQVQTLKKELSSLQKENEQLKVSIENALNWNNIEKVAKEKLGMQKLTNKQTVYVTLPKKDYVEPASEPVLVKDDNSNENWFQKIVDRIFNWQK